MKKFKVNSLDIINLAKSEGLHSHANPVQIRFEDYNSWERVNN